jgi:hypothetical protein
LDEQRRVMKAPLGGGRPVTLVSEDFFSEPGGAIAVNSTGVYWTNETSGPGPGGESFAVMKVALDGGTPVTLASSSGAIAVDSTSIYWTSARMGANDGTVMKVALGGGTPVTLASGQDTPISIAVDATSLYWTNTSGSVMKLTPK